MFFSTPRTTTLSLLFFLLASPVREAGASECPSGVAIVDGQESIDLVCEAANEAVRLLATCGIVQRSPFRARIVVDLPEECPPSALGFFDASTDQVIVASYEECLEMTDSEDRFGIPMSRPLYRSLLVHEFAHALVNQNADIERTAHEYIAYVTQFASMESDLRNRIMTKYPHHNPIEDRELNSSYFYLSPPDFAVKAYSHFNMPGKGCGFVQDLVQGHRKLPPGTP